MSKTYFFMGGNSASNDKQEPRQNAPKDPEDLYQPFKENGKINEKFIKAHGVSKEFYKDPEVRDHYIRKGYKER